MVLESVQHAGDERIHVVQNCDLHRVNDSRHNNAPGVVAHDLAEEENSDDGSDDGSDLKLTKSISQ